MAELKIKVTAETAQAAKQVEAFGKTAVAATSTASKSFDRLSKSTGGATQTLTNFSRVVQDAPFGIIGIANNIDPLIESFSRLKAQTGSSKEAFKQLGATLLGPAGIAIGISAVTSLLIAFGPKILDAISGVSKLDNALKEAGEKGGEAFVNAQVDVDKFLQTLNSATATANQQNQALKGLNSLLDQYGLEVDTIAEAQRVGSEVGKRYAQIKQLEARATALAQVAAQEYGKALANQQAVTEEIAGLTGSAADKILFFVRNAATGFLSLGKATSTVSKSEALQKGFTDEIAKTNSEIQKELTALEGMAEVSVKTTKSTKGLVSEQDALAAAFERAVGPQVTAIAGYQSLNSIMPEITSELKRLNAEKEKEIALNKTAKALELIKGGTTPISTAGKSPAQAATDAMAANNEKLKNSFEEMGTVASFAVGQIPDLFNAAFQSISQGESPIKAITNSLKALIVRLAAAAAAAALLSLFLGGATGGAGAAGAAGGGKFASIFGQLLGFKMAKGGIAMGPTPAIVGDGGPEAVIPLSQLHRLLGVRNSGGNTSVTGTIRGSDIYLTNKRGGDSYARLFG